MPAPKARKAALLRRKISGRHSVPPTIWLSKSRKVLCWCIYTTTLEPILARIADISHAPRAWWLEIFSYAPRALNRRRTPPRGLGGKPTRSFCFSFFAIPPPKKLGKRKNERVGFRPPSIRAVRTAGMQCRLIQKKRWSRVRESTNT